MNDFFKVKKVTKLDEIKIDDVIPTSDMAIQTDTHLFQMEFIETEESIEKKEIKPGIWSFSKSMAGMNLLKQDIKHDQLLESIDNTTAILAECNKFYNRLHIYQQLAKEPKRSILLYSLPGCGKSAAINKIIEELSKEEGTCVIIWDTSKIDSRDVNSFFNQSSEFKNVTKLLLIIEDIGGGSVENHGGARSVDSSLLNLLDGIGRPFQGVPTFIVATTNNPEQTVGALIDRPGRFDKVMELKTPNYKESMELLEFIGKKELTDEDKKAAKTASANGFSIAHLQEVIVRSLIDDVSYLTVVQQLVEHKAKFKNAFNNIRPMGIHGFDD